MVRSYEDHRTLREEVKVLVSEKDGLKDAMQAKDENLIQANKALENSAEKVSGLETDLAEARK